MGNKGFTLIDLMISIAIVGVLSSSVIVNISVSKAKARDVIRLNQINQLSKALEIYYSQYGVFPCGDSNDNIAGTGTVDGNGSGSGCIGGDTQTNTAGFLNATGADPKASQCDDAIGPTTGLFAEGITLTNCPLDPLQDPAGTDGTRNVYLYHASADRKTYLLVAYLETGINFMENDGGRCSRLYEFGSGTGTILPYADTIGLVSDGCI